MMQEKTSQNFTERLHALKTVTGSRWEDIAEQLGVTREHLYNYRAGKHSAPDHVVFRLSAAERAAGIDPENFNVPRGTLKTPETDPEKISVTRVTLISPEPPDHPAPSESPPGLGHLTPECRAAAEAIIAHIDAQTASLETRLLAHIRSAQTALESSIQASIQAQISAMQTHLLSKLSPPRKG